MPIFVEKRIKVDFTKHAVNCKLRDSKHRRQMLKYSKFTKKANLDFPKKCCIFAVRKGRPCGFPFFRPLK